VCCPALQEDMAGIFIMMKRHQISDYSR